mmetsp:Transcript_30786/g.98224  ORF Transcript_30786/g.98224 Transcript_30786/m.98224 type:complete len:235 (+) Transcript_30786:870-1574(+)
MDLLVRPDVGWLGRHLPLWLHVPGRAGRQLRPLPLPDGPHSLARRVGQGWRRPPRRRLPRHAGRARGEAGRGAAAAARAAPGAARPAARRPARRAAARHLRRRGGEAARAPAGGAPPPAAARARLALRARRAAALQRSRGDPAPRPGLVLTLLAAVRGAASAVATRGEGARCAPGAGRAARRLLPAAAARASAKRRLRRPVVAKCFVPPRPSRAWKVAVRTAREGCHAGGAGGA